MAFPSTIAVGDATPTAADFDEIERQGTRVVRINDATTLNLPEKMVVSHNQSGSGINLADRHLIQFAKTEEDAAGNPLTTIVNVTVHVPRGLSGGAATGKSLVARAINFIEGSDAARALGNMDSVLLGES